MLHIFIKMSAEISITSTSLYCTLYSSNYINYYFIQCVNILKTLCSWFRQVIDKMFSGTVVLSSRITDYKIAPTKKNFINVLWLLNLKNMAVRVCIKSQVDLSVRSNLALHTQSLDSLDQTPKLI